MRVFVHRLLPVALRTVSSGVSAAPLPDSRQECDRDSSSCTFSRESTSSIFGPASPHLAGTNPVRGGPTTPMDAGPALTKQGLEVLLYARILRRGESRTSNPRRGSVVTLGVPPVGVLVVLLLVVTGCNPFLDRLRGEFPIPSVVRVDSSISAGKPAATTAPPRRSSGGSPPAYGQDPLGLRPWPSPPPA